MRTVKTSPIRCAPDHDKLPKLDDTSGAATFLATTGVV
jgi:hypothetical protein